MATTGENGGINYTFKILYALGIFFVTAGHVRCGGFSVFYEFIPFNAFHLALFVFASGYFYKSIYESEVVRFVVKKVKHLLVPLYLWNIFYALLIICLKSHHIDLYFGAKVTFATLVLKPIDNGHQFVYNMGGWFVVPLFMVQVYNVLIRKILNRFNFKHPECFYSIIALSLGLLGVSLAEHGINQHFNLCLNRMLYFIPFYQFGILYKKYEHLDKLNNFIYLGLIVIAELIIIYTHNGPLGYVPSFCRFNNGCLMPFIVGILGILFWLRIAKILTPALAKDKVINIIADNTYTIMINQFLAFMLLKGVFAILHRYTIFCAGFNMELFKHQVPYYYVPHELSQMLIVYVFVGLSIPILMQKCVNKIWNFLKQFRFSNFLFSK